jgi:ABC-type lipoprotein release transport system permease subunit
VALEDKPTMYAPRIALRYLLHKRISLLAILSVALGVMVLYVVHSVFVGIEAEFRARTRGSLADLTILKDRREMYFGDRDLLIWDMPALMRRIENTAHVVAVAPRLESMALVAFRSKGGPAQQREYRWAYFAGINLERECGTTRLAEYWLASHDHGGDGLAGADGSDKPTWGEMKNDNVTPAIVGDELASAGRTPNSQEATLAATDSFVLLTPVDATGRGVMRCCVAGRFRSGIFEYDSSTFFVPLGAAQAFLGTGDGVSSIAVRLDDYRHAEEVSTRLLGIPTLAEMRHLDAMLAEAAVKKEGRKTDSAAMELQEFLSDRQGWRQFAIPWRLREWRRLFDVYAERVRAIEMREELIRSSHRSEMLSLVASLRERERSSLGSAFLVTTWENRMPAFLQLLTIQRKVSAIVLSLAIVLAGLGIYSILSSLVRERTRDIGILRSVGATAGGVLSVFLLIGALIGVLGSVLGLAGGALFCRHINAITHVIESAIGGKLFPAEIYNMDHIPVDPSPFAWAIILACTALMVSLWAAVLPGLRAARKSAVDALRYE